jgi:hypothetical protein
VQINTDKVLHQMVSFLENLAASLPRRPTWRPSRL